MKQLNSYEGQHCANCGTAMQGEFCHECGQSIHSVIKPMHGMIEETVETLLHIDGRIVHTLPPLLLKPGFLTLEYFSGRRVRYIAPFRLMFVLCVLAFFVFHLALDNMASRSLASIQPQTHLKNDLFKDADTPAEVREELRIELDNMEKIRNYEVVPKYAATELALSEQKMRQAANKRLTDLGAAPMSAASIAAPAVAASKDDDNEPFPDGMDNSGHMSEPFHIAWLPDMVNERLTLWATRALANWRTYKHGDARSSEEAKQRMINGVFGTLPQTMFVLIPIFAAMLALFYVFRRRLYMEHLIVALHSHAFLFLSLLLILLAGMLSTWLKPHGAWMAITLDWVEILLFWWIPIYLLIMQKRVYRQGWPMTVLKYLFIGWCYCWLLLFALIVAFVLGLAH
ncbi:DUF3667 domain-containing protein [Rhodanobacter sp. MP1X3]|jgi:hypothetical protein|uniref:DUF3667 domain-containing protein n=1 Tax=Rhodanobacter sp. MP1X3 TaxID=2723086 RepID=UPI0016180ACB|nr:DUF3667 domain-containing protein [Rhodanobacter sp. MP1X3]MBB6241153.1 hypothetical protein [Rhodanobacter sp. MP1X3]